VKNDPDIGLGSNFLSYSYSCVRWRRLALSHRRQGNRIGAEAGV